jgi:hypothetical protein
MVAMARKIAAIAHNVAGMVAASTGCMMMKIIVSDSRPAATSDRMMIFVVSLMFKKYIRREDQFKFGCVNPSQGS